MAIIYMCDKCGATVDPHKPTSNDITGITINMVAGGSKKENFYLLCKDCWMAIWRYVRNADAKLPEEKTK